MKREEGYYWVKYHNKWVISHFDPDMTWCLTGWDMELDDKDLDEIDERRIERMPERYLLINCGTEKMQLDICSMLAGREVKITDFTTKTLEKLKNP